MKVSFAASSEPHFAAQLSSKKVGGLRHRELKSSEFF
jgi:hypothetical protein